MKIKTENLGIYALLSSVILIIIGAIGHNDVCLLIGGSVFTLIIGCISKMIDADIKDTHIKSEAKAYAIKRQVDTKAYMLVKAYNDGKISDEYINKVSTPIAEKSVNTIFNNSKELDIIKNKTESILEYRDHIIERNLKYKSAAYEKTLIIERYENLLSNSGLQTLITAEYLYRYNKFNEDNISDYSHLYIMYSKLLEVELAQYMNESKLSLGGIIFKLKKNNEWNEFIRSLEDYDIVRLRNDAAHKGCIKISDVESIREFLFDKKWIDFILSKK